MLLCSICVDEMCIDCDNYMTPLTMRVVHFVFNLRFVNTLTSALLDSDVALTAYSTCCIVAVVISSQSSSEKISLRRHITVVDIRHLFSKIHLMHQEQVHDPSYTTERRSFPGSTSLPLFSKFKFRSHQQRPYKIKTKTIVISLFHNFSRPLK
jgi:hypothetical protein